MTSAAIFVGCGGAVSHLLKVFGNLLRFNSYFLAIRALHRRVKVSAAGRFLTVDPYLSKLLGLPSDRLNGAKFQDITHLSDLDRDMAQVQRLLSKGHGSYSLLNRLLHASGHLVWIELNVYLVTSYMGCEQPFDASIRKALTGDDAPYEIHNKVYSDSLIGAPNRHAFEYQLGAAEMREKQT